MANSDTDVDPEFSLRANKAAEALRAHPAVAYAGVSVAFQDVWAGLKTDCTQELDLVVKEFGLTSPIVTLNYTVEYGIVLDIWWNFAHNYDPPTDHTYTDIIDAIKDKDLFANYLENTLGNPPEDSGFPLLPEDVPNTLPREDVFPLSPPGWNYAGQQALKEQDIDTEFTSAALYFCHSSEKIAKLWIKYDQDADLYHIELVEYPHGRNVIEFKTTADELQSELYDTAYAWLQAQLTSHPQAKTGDIGYTNR